ncbi:MAG: hypothetical protein ACXADB_12575 [Candidatus Hermodarchaeia archaeon]|jgi:hypothetical protein
MKKFAALMVALLLLSTTVAFATTVNRTPDLTIPFTPEANQASYWGENCYKNEGPFTDPDQSLVTLGSPHSVVVLKSATFNFVWFDTEPGKYGTPTEKDVSHLIYCNDEIPPPPPPPCEKPMYYLPGKLYYDYGCYLTMNIETDVPWDIPERFVNEDGITDYAQGLCNQVYTCEGWTTGEFNWSGEWFFVCEYEECLDCE